MNKISYEKVFEQYQKYIPFQQIWQEKYSQTMEAEYKKMFPKSKKLDYKKFPEGWLDNFHNQWKPIANKIWEAYDNRKKLLKKILDELAEEDIEIVFQSEKQKLYQSSPSTYSTQTNSYSYAKGDADIELATLKTWLPEIDAEIVDNTKSEYGKWGMYTYGEIEVWANITAWQYDYLKRNRPFNIIDYCVMCWEHGINPKVKMPFLPDSIFKQSMAKHMGR